jgi:hypothetical protein
MAPSTLAPTDEQLPASLFAVHRAYKRGTAVVVDWLSTFQNSSSIDRTKGVWESRIVTVTQLLERAQVVSKQRVAPPSRVHDAFRIALVNRNKITEYYNDHPPASRSAETAAWTEYHKFFNETLV